MKISTVLTCLSLFLVLAFNALAEEFPRISRSHAMVHGGAQDLVKAGGDTINLMAATNDPTNTSNDGPCHGVEPYYDGDFESAGKAFSWEGWTSRDLTQGESHWQVSNYNQSDPDNHAAWCGDINFPACEGEGEPGGYGNGWNDIIEYSTAVNNPAVSSVVTVTATINYDSEPGYDFTYLSVRYNDDCEDYTNLQVWDGQGFGQAVSASVTYLPPEYVNGTGIVVAWRFQSDGIYSDEDCNYPSMGGCQIDDVNIEINNDGNIVNYFEDFEGGSNLGQWQVADSGVGDFAQIWTGLGDIDPYRQNSSAQVAFIDDGVVVPCVGPTNCITWCYGPGGYIVNNTGGRLGDFAYLSNAIESPVMDWPTAKNCIEEVNGIILEFDVYHHQGLTGDPGMFYTWAVRSADVDGSAGYGIQDISQQPWLDRNFIYGGSGVYTRGGDEVTDLMNPGRDQVQVQLAVHELGWMWGWNGQDGTPSPYFDNVTVKVFPVVGPSMSSSGIYSPQDNFPTRGSLDFGDLPSHSVRFDMAKNIALNGHLRNDPGDTIVASIASVRDGADFIAPPELHYLLQRNPVFTSAMRTAGLPDQGWVEGMPAVSYGGTVAPGKWAFDLPDTGFLFPGDVLHYFIKATDAIGGPGGTDEQTAIMPADTTGYSTGFGDPFGYNSIFTVRALPSVMDDGQGGYDQPEILFINDYGGYGGENEWYTALNNLGLKVGRDYDVYFVNGPSSGVGNGIGGRANADLLVGYQDILYTCGHLDQFTLSNGDFDLDPGDDVGALYQWLEHPGGRDLLLTGDNLVTDLVRSGSLSEDFVARFMGLRHLTNDIRPHIGGQIAPSVRVMPGNPVFTNTDLTTWVAYGGNDFYHTFDGVQDSLSIRLAEFLDPAGFGGAYSYSAATLKIDSDENPMTDDSRVISLPYDLSYVHTQTDEPGHHLPARARLLRDVLLYFGVPGNLGIASNWNISTYNAANLDPGTPDNHAWWCGSPSFESCSPSDPVGGYGNNWVETLEYQTTINCEGKREVSGSIRFDLNIDTEPGLDALVLQNSTDDDPPEIMDVVSGDTTSIDPGKMRITRDFTVDCEGESTTLYLQFVFNSDGSGSDEDCQWPTNGAVQLDNIEVWLDGVLDQGHVEDCEPGTANLWKPLTSAGEGGITGTTNVPAITFSASNFPNPFNPSTTIKYSLPRAGHLRLRIYNVRGQLVKTIIDGPRPAGTGQTVVWDGSNNHGSVVSSGIYFLEAKTEDEVFVRKMALVK